MYLKEKEERDNKTCFQSRIQGLKLYLLCLLVYWGKMGLMISVILYFCV